MIAADRNVTITLINGQQVNTADVLFDDVAYRFYLQPYQDDLTNQIYQRDKAANWSTFDKAKDNERAYVENYMRQHNGSLPPETGSTSVWANFIHQITTDPLAAPLETLDNTTSKLWQSPTIKVVTVLAVVAVALYALNTATKLKP